MRTILAACAVLGGCALLPAPPKPEAAPLRPGEVISAQAAAGGLIPGQSTKADVRGALGQGVVVDFESGYEVWVYREPLREKATPPPTELVLLFAPSGILAKTRIR